MLNVSVFTLARVARKDFPSLLEFLETTPQNLHRKLHQKMWELGCLKDTANSIDCAGDTDMADSVKLTVRNLTNEIQACEAVLTNLGYKNTNLVRALTKAEIKEHARAMKSGRKLVNDLEEIIS